MIKSMILKKEYPSVDIFENGEPVTPDNLILRRNEMKELLERYSYGRTPKYKVQVSGETLRKDVNSYAGKVIEEHIRIRLTGENGEFSFPITLFIPKCVNCPPIFVNIAFRPAPDKYIPIEEITDRGYAIAVMVYTDIVNDNHYGDFSDGLAAYFGTRSSRNADEWGKIGMWAYGASRVLDYLTDQRQDVNADRAIVIGHSRLGKTALWCAAQDERFWGAVSNDSGYGGAASSRHGTGERIADFIRAGSYDWFCESFKDYLTSENNKPYDQAYLLSLIAPRLLCVGSAVEDKAADPLAEFLTTANASNFWELYNVKGLVCPNRLPKVGDHFSEGRVGYHLRANRHFFSREDWNKYMDFFDKKK